MKNKLLIFLIAFLPLQAWTQTIVPNSPRIDGPVTTVQVNSDTAYIGGPFSLIGRRDSTAIYGARANAVNATLQGNWPMPDGAVRKVISDGNGGFYLGGNFTRIGNTPCVSLAHIDSNGMVTSKLGNIGTNGEVYDLLLKDDTLFVAGGFNAMGNSIRNGLLAFDNSCTPLTNMPKIIGNVYAMISDQAGGWFIGGQFSQADQYAVNGLIHINNMGSIDPNFIPEMGSSITIYSLYVSGGVLYVGGSFTSVNNQQRINLAAFNSWTGALQTWNPGCNGLVRGLTGNNLRMYVVGNFTQVGGSSRTGLVAFDLYTGLVDTTWNPPALTNLNQIRLETWNNDLYAVGTFNLNGTSLSSGLAKFQGSNGAFVWSPTVTGGSSIIKDVTISGDLLFVTGVFSSVNGQSRNNVAVFSLPSQSLRPFNTTLPYAGERICAMSDKIYIAGIQYTKGRFFQVDTGGLGNITMLNKFIYYASSISNSSISESNSRLASDGNIILFNRTNISDSLTGPMGAIRLWGTPTPFAILPLTWMNFNAVRSMFLADTMMYYVGYNTLGVLGGGIQAFGYQTRTPRIWSPAPNLTSGFGEIKKIVVEGNTVYVAGNFTSSSPTRYGLASLNKTTGALNSWNPNPSGGTGGINQISDMLLLNGKLYVSGDFSIISGVARNSLVCYNATTGSVNPWTSISPKMLRGLNTYGNYLYGLANTFSGNYACRIDTVTGIRDSWQVNLNNNNYFFDVFPASIAGSPQGIYIGSCYHMMGGFRRGSLAAFRISTGEILPFDPLPSGYSPSAMILRDTMLYISRGGSTYNQIMSIRTLNSTITNIFSYSSTWEAAKAMALQGNKLYVGGLFNLSSPTINNIVVFNINTNTILSTFSGGTGTRVNTICPHGKKVYIGGEFLTVQSSSRTRLAAFDADTYALLPWAPTCDAPVNSLRAQGNTVYGCGTFTTANGQVRNGVAAFDTTTGSLRNWAPSILGVVWRLYPRGRLIYINGQFSSINSQKRASVGAIDTANTFVTPFSMSANINYNAISVNELGFTSNNVIAGGTFTSISGTDPQYLAVMNYNPATLPVSLLKLSASFSGNENVRVTWTTQNEVNNDRFEVERSIDNKDWRIAGNVKGNGNRIKQTSYSFDDKHANSLLYGGNGTLYYRLRQFDYDGKYSVSGVVQVSLRNEEDVSTELFPNPFDVYFSIRSILPSTLKVYNMNGLIVLQGKYEAGEQEVSTESLCAGLYIVEVKTDRSIEHFRLIRR